MNHTHLTVVQNRLNSMPDTSAITMPHDLLEINHNYLFEAEVTNFLGNKVKGAKAIVNT